jgi:hypothetical protein
MEDSPGLWLTFGATLSCRLQGAVRSRDASVKLFLPKLFTVSADYFHFSVPFSIQIFSSDAIRNFTCVFLRCIKTTRFLLSPQNQRHQLYGLHFLSSDILQRPAGEPDVFALGLFRESLMWKERAHWPSTVQSTPFH